MLAASDWIGIATVLTVVLGTFFGAFWGRKKGDQNEQPLVTFNDDDRRLLNHLRDALGRVAIDQQDRRLLFELRDLVGGIRDVMLSLGRRIEQLADAMADHRRKVQDNTAGEERVIQILAAVHGAIEANTAAVQNLEMRMTAGLRRGDGHDPH